MLPLAKSQRVEVGGCITIRGIIHEIGHIIGFYHEFIRPDRDRYVYISDNLVRSQPNNYRKINSIDTFNLPFDYHSVMNYYNLITHDRAYQDIIGRGQGLSFLDIKLANQMYKCSEDCKPRPLCPNEGFVDKDCKCYCKGKPGGEPIELCNIFNVTQVGWRFLFKLFKPFLLFQSDKLYHDLYSYLNGNSFKKIQTIMLFL